MDIEERTEVPQCVCRFVRFLRPAGVSKFESDLELPNVYMQINARFAKFHTTLKKGESISR